MPGDEFNLTKEQAYELMLKGHKVAHRYFGSDEYIFIDEHGRMYAEDGCRFERGWNMPERCTEEWQTGWHIYQDKKE